MAEITEPFTLKHRHLQAVIKILQGLANSDADLDSDVNLNSKAKEDLALVTRVLSSSAGTAAKDTTDPLKGGEIKPGSQESARGADKRASDSVLARARDSRMNSASSPFAGVPDYTPGQAPPRARDGSIISIDALFRHDASTAGGADVSIEDIFGKQPPTLANG